MQSSRELKDFVTACDTILCILLGPISSKLNNFSQVLKDKYLINIHSQLWKQKLWIQDVIFLSE